MVADIMKIDQSIFVRDLIIKEKFTDCNANVISIKAGSAIKISDLENYNKTDLQKYQ